MFCIINYCRNLMKTAQSGGRMSKSAISSKLSLFISLALVLEFSSQVSAVTNFKECLDCFYANRTSSIYCQSNRKCLPLKSTQCSPTQIIYKDYQCVQSFSDCTNVTFTQNSVSQQVQFGFALQPGQGCYVQIDRLNNGSYGTMAVSFDDPTSILVFDAQEKNYQSGTVLGMPVTEQGWGARKIFVVNRGDQQAGFSVSYVGAIFVQCSMIAVALLSLSLTFI